MGAALRAGASLGEPREKARAAATQEDCAFSRGSPKNAAEGRPCPQTERNLFASLRLCVLLLSIGQADAQNYPGCVDAVVQAFKPHLKLGLVKEGLQKIAGKFAMPDHVGSRYAAEFDDTLDEEERAIRRRDAFEKENYLMFQLGIVG